VLEGAAIGDVLPGRWTADDVALVEPGAGYVDVPAWRDALCRGAGASGVRRVDEHVLEVAASTSGEPRVVSATTEVLASTAFLAVGSGTAELSAELAPRLRARRIGYVFFDGLLPAGLGTLNDSRRGLWWRPAPLPGMAERYLVGRAVDEAADGTCQPVTGSEIEHHVREGLRGLLEDPTRGSRVGGVSSFDMSLSGDQQPWATAPSGRVVAATGFDGGGLKTAPALADHLTTLLLGDSSS
jgi:glycine/D-amino acid oxidase-like deaminating enzyme